MAALNLSYTALHIDIVAIFVRVLPYVEYFAQCRYVSCFNSVGNITYVSPMFKIIAIQMKPKESSCILNLQKYYTQKAAHFSNICLQNPTISGDWACQDWKIFVSDILLYRVRHVVIPSPPFCF